MNSPNPFAAPASLADGEQATSNIDQLTISDTWKKRFHLIEKAGGPDLPQKDKLTRGETFNIGFNILALLFGLFYYLFKGMWKKGLVIFGAFLAAYIVAEIVMGLMGVKFGGNMLGIAAAVMFATRANRDYYKRMVLGDDSWW